MKSNKKLYKSLKIVTIETMEFYLLHIYKTPPKKFNLNFLKTDRAWQLYLTFTL